MRNQEQNSIRNTLSQIRHDIWMWMALWSTSEPTQPSVIETQTELEYLFENPTGNTLDFYDTNELYSMTESDLEDLICDHEHIENDDFGYDHLDIDNSTDLW